MGSDGARAGNGGGALVIDRPDVGRLIRDFAAHPLFRSAVVEELELDGDFYRRPLRPEDLEFIDFSIPVTADTVCHLPSLASQRILRCIYDLEIARLPHTADRRELERCASFYSDTNRILAAQIRPFLEDFAFGFAQQSAKVGRNDVRERCRAAFGDILRAAEESGGRILENFLQGAFAEEALRFILIQKWCLADGKRVALAKATATGYFDPLRLQDRPGIEIDQAESEALMRLAGALGAAGQGHAYWQFYLPTSLAETNYLSALASRPDRAIQLFGATFAAEAEWHNFVRVAVLAGEHLGVKSRQDQHRTETIRQAADLEARFARTLNAVEDRFGAYGLSEMSRGLEAARRLAHSARRDLDEQLQWLTGIDRYTDFARRIDERVRQQQPDIDRETFVEPREMCSTTHVHDDHRLVVIESGHMVFWGNLGMRMRMAPGDMILVPKGRLHGSSVESDQCTYHQPIIPEEWVRPLIDEINVGGQ
jgi:mannose-6-phosphate isomerase-like protein (cupin superfamily)